MFTMIPVEPVRVPKNIAILIFDNVTILDFTGPYDVFTHANREDIKVYTVAENLSVVTGYGNLCIMPNYSIFDCPKPDILIIPGGLGTRKEMHNPIIIEWIKQSYNNIELMFSVCSGALLLAKAGLLDGLKATTHHNVFGLLEEIAPTTEIIRDRRFVDNGKILLSAGISAGIDLSLFVVEKVFGKERALQTTNGMEYQWSYSNHGEL
ncbi:DJ-1/PfpI family protein [Paenibacillus sp. LHD-38]|uniref:DJ-1/PfpI family protein n=1 Tax=Paenibacillus sp. LHD-38 TaxID=3072143 RepID=UPI002810005B|nr:DJ-1/PfpI family protein [Paenibacillus sp. LHD-38]MDQ8738706.1 DJ-1/PfpI family protein [Paenibacillus sp. LHD-38]